MDTFIARINLLGVWFDSKPGSEGQAEQAVLLAHEQGVHAYVVETAVKAHQTL